MMPIPEMNCKYVRRNEEEKEILMLEIDIVHAHYIYVYEIASFNTHRSPLTTHLPSDHEVMKYPYTVATRYVTMTFQLFVHQELGMITQSYHFFVHLHV